MKTLFAVALSVMLLVVTPAALSQSKPGYASYQGVSWPAGEGVPLVRSQATSTGAIFAQTFYRTNEVYQPIEIDSRAFFFRVVQTVQPLAQLGTVEQILEIMGNDAKMIATQLGTAEEGIKVSECKRIVAGAMRTGKSVSGIVLPGLSKPQSVTGRYECYAFEHQGKGIGVIVKIATSNEAMMSQDAAHSEAVLRWLELEAVSPLEPYDAMIHGGRFSLPVASVVSNVQQPQQGLTIADVQMAGAQARILAAATGYADNPKEAFETLRTQMQTDNHNTIKNAQAAKVLVERDLRLATGDGNLLLLTFPMLVYQNGEELLLNTVLSRHDSTSTYASVTVSLADPEVAGSLLRAIGTGMQGGRDKLHRLQETRLVPGVRLSVDSTVGVERALRDGLVELSPSYFGVGRDRIDTLHEGKSFISIGVAAEGETLESLHEAYVKAFLKQNASQSEKLLATLTDGTAPVAPNPSLGLDRPWLRTRLKGVAENATPMDDVSVSSALVEYPGTKHRLVVHSVSPTPLRGIELEAAESVILGATVLKEDERHRVGVLELDGELGQSVWYGSDDLLAGTSTYFTMLRDSRVYVTVYNDDPHNSVLSKKLLADRNVRLGFERFLFKEELRAFREKPDELVETTLAGREAMMIQKLYTGKNQGGSGERNDTANIRGYGVRHGDGYTVVMIVQEKEADDARLDAIAEMFVTPAE